MLKDDAQMPMILDDPSESSEIQTIGVRDSSILEQSVRASTGETQKKLVFTPKIIEENEKRIK